MVCVRLILNIVHQPGLHNISVLSVRSFVMEPVHILYTLTVNPDRFRRIYILWLNSSGSRCRFKKREGLFLKKKCLMTMALFLLQYIGWLSLIFTQFNLPAIGLGYYMIQKNILYTSWGCYNLAYESKFTTGAHRWRDKFEVTVTFNAALHTLACV